MFDINIYLQELATQLKDRTQPKEYRQALRIILGA